MIGKCRAAANLALSAAIGSGNSDAIRGSPARKAASGRRTMTASNSPASRRSSSLVRRQNFDADALGWTSEGKFERLGALELPDFPGDIARLDSVLVPQEAADDDRGGHVVF